MNNTKPSDINSSLVVRTRPPLKRHTRPAQATPTSSHTIVLGIVYVLCTAILVAITAFWVRTLLLYV